MGKNKTVGLIVFLILIAMAIFYFSRDSNSSTYDSTSSDSAPTNAGVNSDESNVLSENGESKYMEFNQAKYEEAISEDKIVLLYFYASWCPICRAEQPEVIDAFNELEKAEIIGFRVNYRDSDTDEFEESLAEEFGITYQHTKIIIKDGTQVLKSLESWNKNRYLEELNKL